MGMRNTEQLLGSIGRLAHKVDSLAEANAALKNYGPESFHGDRISVKKSQISSLLLQSKISMSVPCPVRHFLKMSSRDVFYRPSVKTLFNCCWASAGRRPYSWAIWEFLFNGSMVESIWDCSTVQSAVCLSKCLADAPVFLLGATCHFVWLSCKVCTEIVVHRMFAVFLNSPNGKNSSRSIVRKIFSVYFFYSRFQD